MIAFSAFLEPEIITSSRASPVDKDNEITWFSELTWIVCPSKPKELISKVQGKSWSDDMAKLPSSSLMTPVVVP